MANSRPKLHHFLPKHCYLNAFKAEESPTGDPFVWVHEAGKEPRLQNVNKTAAQKELYTIYNDKGEPNSKLEEFLAGEEARLSVTVQKSIQNRGDYDFTVEERNNVAQFIGMMIVRSPIYKQQMRRWIPAFKKACQVALEGGIPTVLEGTLTAYDQLVFRDWLLGFTDKEIQDYLERMPSEEKVFTERLVHDMHANAKIIFEEMHWMFLLPPKDKEFATCDSPVFRHVPDKKYFNAGLAQPDVIVYFPLSPNLCFYALKNHTAPVDRSMSSQFYFITPQEVEMVNYYMATGSSRYLYSHNKDIGVEEVLREKLANL